nr:HEPN domain-containing protein [Candidatus Freyarchaeota archaeon]
MNQKEARDEKLMAMAVSFLNRTENKLYEAENHLNGYNYPESVSVAQECKELSIKVPFLLLQEKYPKRHEFEEDEFVVILKKIPEKLEHLNFPKLYLYSKFWLNFYTTAKYGLEKLGVRAEKLFKRERQNYLQRMRINGDLRRTS